MSCLTCDICGGSGRVVEITTHIVDRGTKWQRSSDEQIRVECPACDGSGFASDSNQEHP